MQTNQTPLTYFDHDGHLSEDDYFARYERMNGLFDAGRIEDEEHDSLVELLDRADAFGEISNLAIVDGLLDRYESER